MSLKIVNGRIIDGCGNPWYRANVLIEGDMVTKVGMLTDVKADNVIDAKDNIVCPGFFDLHTHDDFLWPIDKEKALELLAGKVSMGVTTEIGGNCGYSTYPISDEYSDLWKNYCSFLDAGISWKWNDLDSYLKFMERNRCCVNFGNFVGHGAVRVGIMGFDPSTPNEEQMNRMRSLVEEAMKQGCFGMTVGLLYPPGIWSSTEELVELCKVVAKYGGFYASHLRGESENLLDATRELVRVGEQVGLPVHNSHIEAWGKEHFWKVRCVLRMIDEAREVRGIDVTADMFPYSGANTTINAIYPPWALEGGLTEVMKRLKNPELRKRVLEDIEAVGKNLDTWPHNIAGNSGDHIWDGMMITWTKSGRNRDAEGKTFEEYGKLKGKHPFDAAVDLTIDEMGAVEVIYFGSSGMREEDWRSEGNQMYIKHHVISPESDAILLASCDYPHPAGWGFTARMLGKYVRQLRLFPWEEAVRKMTSLPAQRLGIRDRGLLREGFKADVVIFDPKTVDDRATYENGKQSAVGFDYVICNGQVTFENGSLTYVFPGQPLRRQTA